MAEPQTDEQEDKKSSREIVFEEIYRLKLEKHILELEEQGYNVPVLPDTDLHARKIKHF